MDNKRRTVTEHMASLLGKMNQHCWEEWELRKEECEDLRPLLVFVNTRSGGQQGVEVLQEMQLLLHTQQVVDLKQETPDAALEWWGKTGVQFRVLVCGGDGTVGWVLGVLERLQLEYTPPVAILPLGTGNDLARVMGWGGGFTGGSIDPVLRSVSSAHVALLDRWQVSCRDLVAPPVATRASRVPGMFAVKKEGMKRALTKGFPKTLEAQGRKSMVLCNYFGIGVDAAVALDFHTMREKSPHLFVSRAVNKIWYAKSGAMSTLMGASANIHNKITVYCDGEEIELPDKLEGVIVLNIASFGGGTDLWGPEKTPKDSDEEDSDDDDSDNSDSPKSQKETASWRLSAKSAVITRPSMADKMLEVVGVHGAAQLGAAQVGLYTAERLAQAKSVRIENKVEIPVEVDGEPWIFAKDGEVEITHKSQAFMLQRSKESNHAVATDIVDWALQKQVIDMEQRDTMMKEIARRVQVQQSLAGCKSSNFG